MSHRWVRIKYPIYNNSKNFHVLPVDDEPSHQVIACPCNPKVERDAISSATVHTAWDGSEVPLLYTYETGIDEPIHPDPEVAARFREEFIADCPNGCKVYSDPRSDVLVLAHNSNYGCRIRKADIA